MRSRGMGSELGWGLGLRLGSRLRVRVKCSTLLLAVAWDGQRRRLAATRRVEQHRGYLVRVRVRVRILA